MHIYIYVQMYQYMYLFIYSYLYRLSTNVAFQRCSVERLYWMWRKQLGKGNIPNSFMWQLMLKKYLVFKENVVPILKFSAPYIYE